MVLKGLNRNFSKLVDQILGPKSPFERFY